MVRGKSAVVLLVIAVLAFLLTYTWRAGLIAGRAREDLAIRYVAYDGPRRIALCVQNNGTVPLTITELYIRRPDGTVLRCYDGFVSVMQPALPEELEPGEVVVFSVEWEEEHGLRPGDPVLVRAVTARGNMFEAEVSVR